ncbi:MAG: hypothetical protein JRC60_07375 [Deltaproteobacteria bacterium]|nr:hypothetical protein [Deltaproteobacteria bacterium]
MKRLYMYFLIMLFVPFILGMGSMTGDDSPDKIPVTEKKFSATFVDQMDVVTRCTEVSIEGKTFVEGVKGEGTYTIPFEKIKSVGFFLKDGKLKGLVLLRNNNRDELILNKDYKVYGRTSYGTFQIGILDLRKMIMGE